MAHRTGWLLAGLWLARLTPGSGGRGRCALPEGYDPSRRPGAREVATPVVLGVFVVDVDRVDDMEQSFRVDILVTANWTDERLLGLPA